ncbi:acyl-CoA thioesterase YbgC [Corynebacterium occultum]|uniref:Acyl-CoA thioesterase YbgC n=1 Tax=Corynebacterium occultum TaxID=2675219 RepID=A0A6B8WA09_9CORY|nr:thioesterase family protein [Corynebacterium occultum]QGU08105.1 acyl-CoA thioesterase YbgC [Corynebacterium occultum]
MVAPADSTLHTMQIPVRWSDFDRYGHIMNASYIEIAQEARLAFAEEEFTARGMDFAVFVRHLDVDYLRPVLPDTTELTVETQVVELGNTSFTTRQELKDRQNRVACVVECVQVAVDTDTSRPRELNQAERKVLTQTADSVEKQES